MSNPDEYGTPSPSSAGGGAISAGAGLLNVAAGIYDSHQNRKVAKENTDKTLAANKAEAELAFQRSLQLWNMQNAYNTPEAQMNRFKEAGLNPHLIYGQGNSGNAAAPSNYQPPQQNYRYEAPAYGAAVQSILPMLMQVGNWMQDMRLKEAALRGREQGLDTGELNQEKIRQLIDYMYEKNPRALKEMDNRLSLFPYQKQAQVYAMNKGHVALEDMRQEFRHKFGEELFRELTFLPDSPTQSFQSGTKRLQFLKSSAETRLKQAQASWTDFDITNPQALMQMVLSGVMGLAGQQLRLSTHKPGKVIHETSEQMRGGRIKTRRRIYEK